MRRLAFGLNFAKWEFRQNTPCVGRLAIPSGEDTDCLELEAHCHVQFPDTGGSIGQA